MRLSKKNSTSAVLVLCIVFSMFYYNIFHLMSNVKLKNIVYVQSGHYNEVDNNREIKSYKENKVIKDLDNYKDSNDDGDSYFYKDYEFNENDRYLIHLKYNIIDSSDKLIRARDDSEEYNYLKSNNIGSVNFTQNNEEKVRHDIKLIDSEINKINEVKVVENIIEENNKSTKIKKENVEKYTKEDNNTTNNIKILNSKNVKEKVNNDIKENPLKVEKLIVGQRNDTTNSTKDDIKQNDNRTEKINVSYESNTDKKIKKYIREKNETLETTRANHKDMAEGKNTTDIQVNEKMEKLNINKKNRTKEKEGNDFEEKNAKIEERNVNHENKTVEKEIHDKNTTVNKGNNDTKEKKLSVDENQINIDSKQINNHTDIIKTENNVKLLVVNHANVTTVRTSHKQVPKSDLLINTSGCLIPDYGKTMTFKEAANKGHTCGKRAVFVHKIVDDEIMFTIDEKKMNDYKKGNETYKCCYKFVSRATSKNLGIQDTKITYSPCVLFTNRTKIKLKQEVIAITCGKDPVKMFEIIYEDVYIVVKKTKKDEIKVNKRKTWNVLILGMDTMSRARAYKNMPRTMQYFQQNDWLDYRGYQKVGYNTFPNLVALLTGKTNVYRACKPSMDHCNDLFIWSQFRNASYATAYGEDFLTLPDTFKNYGGFEIPPTEHYMRPFYLTGEHVAGNLVCTKKLPSAVHMLEYAHDFAQTYKYKNFFGMFWINSYSHNDFNTPTLFDQHTRDFFEKIPMTGALNNTFIIFLSDHGIRYGEMRYSMESYYEERLPMFYMWVPYEFRKDYTDKYNSLKLNQHRLVTPYDLHATLWEILKMSRDSVTITKSESCPNCTSLFEEKSVHRTCAEAAVDKKWCSCHKLEPVDIKDAEHEHCLTLAVSSIQNITKEIKTIECTRCSALRLKKILRVHSYNDNSNNKTYFIVAFLLSPGDVGYEVTIEKDNTGYYIVTPTTTITAYNTRGDCTVNKLTDRPYCVCEKIRKCYKKPKR